MKLRERLKWIDEQDWPPLIKRRARALLKAELRFREVRVELDKLPMMDPLKPRHLMEAQRRLKRLAEEYYALASELAFHHTTQGSNYLG